MSPDSAQFAISIAVSYADAYSHVDVAQGAVITAGMTNNIATDGKVKSEAEAKSGLFADGTAGLAFAIELSDLPISRPISTVP